MMRLILSKGKVIGYTLVVILICGFELFLGALGRIVWEGEARPVSLGISKSGHYVTLLLDCDGDEGKTANPATIIEYVKNPKNLIPGKLNSLGKFKAKEEKK